MAKDTNIQLRQDVIYSVYVRSHTAEGTFRSIIPDLDRIRALGTDIIWFMPIHPIGVQGKKGSLGCPYANRDYRTVNPEYGTMEDFQALVEEIHKRDMKCIIDVVYNHTSPDSTLTKEHPEFFYRRPDGSFGNHIGDWTDVVDLDYSVPALWDYQIESLMMWAKIVDGFRCDVASFVPVEFWCKAREAVSRVRPDCIWLAETVHSGFGLTARNQGMYSANDYEMFSAFDMEYEYDIREVFDKYLRGEIALSHYMDMLNFQECVYPSNYIKMRCLENHDQPRIRSFIKDEAALINYTAFLYFLKGTTLLYAGQEFENDHQPSLFEQEVFSRETGKDLTPLLQKLYSVKKIFLDCDDFFHGSADDRDNIAILERDNGKTKKFGIFSLKAKASQVRVPVADGTYTNLVDGQPIAVKNGLLCCDGNPIILAGIPSSKE